MPNIPSVVILAGVYTKTYTIFYSVTCTPHLPHFSTTFIWQT